MKGAVSDGSEEALRAGHAGNLPGDVSGVDAGAVSVSPSSRIEESRGQCPGGQWRFREQGESQPVLGPEGPSGRRAGTDPRRPAGT